MAGGDGAIAKVTKAGEVTEYPVPTAGDPTEIAVGPDNNLWYTDPAANLVGRITPAGTVTEFTQDLSVNAGPHGIALGPDGNRWFTETSVGGRIGRITTAGEITEYSNGFADMLSPWDIAAGPDGNMWLTGSNIPGLVGRITLPPLVRDMDADTIGATSARLRGKLRANSQAERTDATARRRCAAPAG